MRSAGNFSPEWGYLAPAPSFMRTARMVVVATAVGATAGAAVVLSLVDRSAPENSRPLVAAHAIVTSVQAATPPTVPLASASAPSGVKSVNTVTVTNAPMVQAPGSVVPTQMPLQPEAPQASLPDAQSGNPVAASPSPSPQPPAGATASRETPPAAAAAPTDVTDDTAAAPAETPPPKKSSGGHRGYSYDRPRPFPIETVLRRLFTAHPHTSSYYPNR
jgi:hypothetical protein